MQPIILNSQLTHWTLDSEVRKHLKNPNYDGVFIDVEQPILSKGVQFFRANTARLEYLTVDSNILIRESEDRCYMIMDNIPYEYCVSAGVIGIYGHNSQIALGDELDIRGALIPENINQRIVHRVGSDTLAIQNAPDMLLDDSIFKLNYIEQLALPEDKFITYENFKLPSDEAYRLANESLVVFYEIPSSSTVHRAYFDKTYRVALMLFCEFYTYFNIETETL